MKAFTDIYKSAGFDISKDPAVLGTLYNAYNLDSAEQNLTKNIQKKDYKPSAGNTMGPWISRNLP